MLSSGGVDASELLLWKVCHGFAEENREARAAAELEEAKSKAFSGNDSHLATSPVAFERMGSSEKASLKKTACVVSRPTPAKLEGQLSRADPEAYADFQHWISNLLRNMPPASCDGHIETALRPLKAQTCVSMVHHEFFHQVRAALRFKRLGSGGSGSPSVAGNGSVESGDTLFFGRISSDTSVFGKVISSSTVASVDDAPRLEI